MKVVRPDNFLRSVACGFTLVEVLIAVFILAIGLIMIITVFPVGGEWTRQATEGTISQNVAQNALTIIQAHFPSNSKALTTLGVGTTLVPFPGLSGNTMAGVTDASVIPETEMCYQFGSDAPCPANPAKANYFWTALVRQTPGQSSSPTTKYDVYILVFKKGSPDQTYPTSVTINGTGYPEMVGVRNTSPDPAQPTLAQVAYPSSTQYDSSSGKILIAPTNATLIPAIDEFGIGVTSGTVFRQGILLANGVPTSATPRPMLSGMMSQTDTPSEQVVIGIPANGATVSPLIYVYQTTLAWKAQ